MEHPFLSSWSFASNASAPYVPAIDASEIYSLVTSDEQHPLYGGFIVGVITVVYTICLELLSISAVRGVLNQKGGVSLYATAACLNILNNLLLGPLIWWFAVENMCRSTTTPSKRALDTVGLLLVHAVGYYLAHAAMHRPSLYRFHKLHHQFHVNVTPLAANCVTTVEYLVAYMAPFVVGIFLFRPDRTALLRAVSLISFNNILIHTPALHDVSESYLPCCFVSTSDHIEHHKKLTTKYAAPTIAIDRVVEAVARYYAIEKPYWPGPKPRSA